MYSRNSSCSASIGSAGQSGSAAAIRSWYQWSRPSTIVDLVAAAPDDDDVLDRRRVGQRLVGGRLEREHLAAAVSAVGGDQHLGLGVVDPVGERLGGEAAEHDAVRRADAGAGEHRHRGLGDHRHVDVDPVALLDAEALEHVGEPLHLVEQLGVGDRARVAGLALPVERDLVAASGVRRGGRDSCPTR